VDSIHLAATDERILMNNNVRYVLFSYRFLLELMVKSMVEHLHATQSLDAPRKMRFSQQFTDDVTTLVATITSDIISRYNKDAKVISSSYKSKLYT
jgi:hypothetical protein